MKYTDVWYGLARNYTTSSGGKKYICIHNTSNTASAANEASYATRRTDSVSSHYYVDGVRLYQTIDTKDQAWHAGSYQGNRYGISYEIVGTNGKSRAWWIANVNWEALGRQIAGDMKTYGIANRHLTVSQASAGSLSGIVTHNDMRLAWGGTTHDDPGPNFPMDYLIKKVDEYLNPGGTGGGYKVPEDKDDDMAFDNYEVPKGAAFNTDGTLLNKDNVLVFGMPTGKVTLTLTAVSDDYGTGPDPVNLRVAVHNGAKWTAGVYTVSASNPAVRIPLSNATLDAAAYKVSVGRVEGGSLDAPCSLVLVVNNV